MRYRSGYCALIVSLAFLVQMGLFSSSCRKPSTTSEPGNAAPASPGGINGRYVAGVKRFDGVAELFKLDITRQGNDVSGVLDFLSSMLDSIEAYADNPQKIDSQVFENFAERSVKIIGKVNGNTVEFDQVEPLVVGNYVYTWHFTGQIQSDKLTGSLEEKMKNEDKDEATENTQTLNISFNRVENK